MLSFTKLGEKKRRVGIIVLNPEELKTSEVERGYGDLSEQKKAGPHL